MPEKIASKEMVIFNLGREKFALSTEQVRSIEEMQAIVPVPQSPEYVSGLINLRGEIIAVIDLRRRLKLKEASQGRDVVIVVVEHGGEAVGLVVDQVYSVEAFDAPPKAVPDSIAKTAQGGFYQSVLELADEKIIILNLDNILSVEEVK
jgi:purine-binding chemotaxis protein CheW